MSIIGHRPKSNKPTILAMISAYLDTVVMFFRKLPTGIRSDLSRSAGKRVRMPPVKDPLTGRIIGHRVVLQKPSRQTLLIADRYQTNDDPDYAGVLSEVHIAFDFAPTTMSTPEMANWLVKNTLLQRRRSRTGMVDVHGVTATSHYWSQYAGKGRKNGRDLILYQDRLSKLDGTPNACHLELRYQNAQTIKKNGINRAAELIDLDPRSHVIRQLKFVQCDTDAPKRRTIRDAVMEDRMRPAMKSRKGTTRKTLDRYRASLTTRIETLWTRSLMDRATGVQDNRPELLKSMQTIDHGVFNIPITLRFVDDMCDQVVSLISLNNRNDTPPLPALSCGQAEKRDRNRPTMQADRKE